MQAEDLLLGYRFGVSFMLRGKNARPIEARFQRAAGLGASVRVKVYEEGGGNLGAHCLPERIEHENLVLERGRLVEAKLDIDVSKAMTTFSFVPCTVMVTLLDENREPAAGWMFVNAYPVRWRLSDLDAARTEVAIETLELAYSRMQVVET